MPWPFIKNNTDNNNSNNNSGYASPHTRIRILNKEESEATMAKIEQTRFDLRVAVQGAEENVQRCILNIKQIDKSRHPNQADRQYFMQMLRVYVGQYKVINVMRNNIENIYNQKKLHELTSEFSDSMTKMAETIRNLSRHAEKPGKLVNQVRNILRPVQNQDYLAEYERLYTELSSMYTSEESADPAGISNDWLELIVSGEADWMTAPIMTTVPPQQNAAQETPVQIQPQTAAPVQNSPSSQAAAMEDALRRALSDD